MTVLQRTARTAALGAVITALCFVPPARALADSPCLAAIKTTGKATSYRILYQAPANKFDMKAEIQRPSAMHVVETVNGRTTEITAIGKKMWMRTDGAWKPLAGMDTTSVLASDPLAFTNFKEQTCTAAGMASWGGSPVRVYHVSWTVLGKPHSDTIDLDERGRIVHMVETQGAQAGATTDVSDYDNVTVSAP